MWTSCPPRTVRLATVLLLVLLFLSIICDDKVTQSPIQEIHKFVVLKEQVRETI